MATSPGPLANHEYVALRLIDFGFQIDLWEPAGKFGDVLPGLIGRGLVERRAADGLLHVTGQGRRAAAGITS